MSSVQTGFSQAHSAEDSSAKVKLALCVLKSRELRPVFRGEMNKI
jgi:hypothetical protein